MDTDLTEMTREELIEEVIKLRRGIRKHRDSSGQELCWHHPALWSLLPEKTDPLPEIPEWPTFMEGCVEDRSSLDRQLPNARRTAVTFEGKDPEAWALLSLSRIQFAKSGAEAVLM